MALNVMRLKNNQQVPLSQSMQWCVAESISEQSFNITLSRLQFTPSRSEELKSKDSATYKKRNYKWTK